MATPSVRVDTTFVFGAISGDVSLLATDEALSEAEIVAELGAVLERVVFRAAFVADLRGGFIAIVCEVPLLFALEADDAAHFLFVVLDLLDEFFLLLDLLEDALLVLGLPPVLLFLGVDQEFIWLLPGLLVEGESGVDSLALLARGTFKLVFEFSDPLFELLLGEVDFLHNNNIT